MTRWQIFRLYFILRRQHLGVFGAALVALREATRPVEF